MLASKNHLILSIVLIFSGMGSSAAQTVPRAELLRTPETIDRLQPTPIAPPIPDRRLLPRDRPLLDAPPPSDRDPNGLELMQDRGLEIQAIEVVGNTILEAEIANIIETYIGRILIFEDLLQLEEEIELLYRDRGYETTGVITPAQIVENGRITIQVIEGEIEEIRVEGLQRLQGEYIRSRLRRSATKPLNTRRLNAALQLLNQSPFIAEINASVEAGTEIGQNILLVKVTESPAIFIGSSVTNYRSPSIGEIEGTIFARHENLSGWGDRLSLSYSRSEGFYTYDLGYVFPVNALDGRVSLNYSYSENRIIEDDFAFLGIRGEAQSISLGYRQPLYVTPRREFAIGLNLDWRSSRTFLFDDFPFSFSLGPEKGESKVTVLRLFAEWSDRSPNRILAARSQFNFGLDGLGATVNDTGTDGRFFSWLGQVQWVQRLSSNITLVTQLNAQLTPDSLLPLERFSIGGINDITGYRQNQRVADNGIWGAIAMNIPLTDDPQQLQITPSFAMGTVWNNNTPNGDRATLASLGLGLRWQMLDNLFLDLDYGIPLIPVENRGNSLQDRGLFFSVRYEFG